MCFSCLNCNFFVSIRWYFNASTNFQKYCFAMTFNVASLKRLLEVKLLRRNALDCCMYFFISWPRGNAGHASGSPTLMHKRHDVARVRVRLLLLQFGFCLLCLHCAVCITSHVTPRQILEGAPFATMLQTVWWMQLPFLNSHFNLHRDNVLRTHIDDTVSSLWTGPCYCTSWPALPHAFFCICIFHHLFAYALSVSSVICHTKTDSGLKACSFGYQREPKSPANDTK